MWPDPLFMGILNVTPDSFSDGGVYLDPDAALRQAERMVNEGVHIIDVGGESSRPGADAVEVEEELRRVIPIVEAVAKRFAVTVSIDTTKWEVAHRAVSVGARMINDIDGGRDPRMARLVADNALQVVLMHRQGNAKEMQKAPHYPNGVVAEIRQFLEERVRRFEECGVDRKQIWVDPGIGFGKSHAHNLELLNRLGEFAGIGGRLVIAASRKSFLARILGDEKASVEAREPGTIAASLWAWTQGASVFRVHDVKQMKSALTTWGACAHAGQP